MDRGGTRIARRSFTGFVYFLIFVDSDKIVSVQKNRNYNGSGDDCAERLHMKGYVSLKKCFLILECLVILVD